MGSVNLISGGLDVQGIVDSLIYLEREPVRRLESQTTALQKKVTAFQTLNTRVSALLDKANEALFKGEGILLQIPYTFEERLQRSIFAMRKTTSSDEDTLTVTAGKAMSSGTYSVTVGGLARAKSMASANFADTDTTLTGTGTLVFQIGSEDPVTVTIDSTNNTLEGVRKAINAANAGVTASIVNDGTGTPYRLLIASDDTGTANAFTVTDNLAGGQALTLAETVAAADAQINVNGINIVKSTNSISDVIAGVTLDLKKVNASPVTVTVTPDIDGIVAGMKELADAYNEINSYISAQFKYDATKKVAGVLSGDATLRNTQMKLQQVFTQSVSNTLGDFRVIGQIGFEFNNDGSISIDETELRDKLSSDLVGVAGLMLGEGVPEVPDGIDISDPRVSYNGKTAATQSGTYDITVSALATQGAVTGSQAITALTQDETLTITYGGNVTTVDLLLGDDLVTILGKINTALAGDGSAVTASDDGSGHIQIATDNYGSSESVTVVSDGPGAAGSTGFDTVGATDTGTDIAGTINGHAAIGSGLILTGASGQPEEGLSLTVNQSTTGSYGSITLTSGTPGQEGASILVNLRTALKNITDPLSGPIHTATDGLNNNIRDINDQIRAYEDRLEVRAELLTREFSRADQALKLLTVSQASLSGQISSLSNLTR